MINNYNKYVINISQWAVMALLVLLWLTFLLETDKPSDGFSVNTRGTLDQLSSPAPVNIAQYHIFGSPQQLYDVPINASQTSLDLILNGTMSSADTSTGMAYISSVQGEQKMFKVGAKVFNLATLKEIHSDHVVLSHNGRDERLSLSDENITITTTTRSQKKVGSGNAPPGLMKHLNGAQQRSWQEMVTQQKFDPGKISNIVSNINMVTDQTGAIQGLRVSNLAQGSDLTKHGLKSNDIITEVNGKKISGQNMLSIRQMLVQNPKANITIKRNGKLQNIQVNLSDISK